MYELAAFGGPFVALSGKKLSALMMVASGLHKMSLPSRIPYLQVENYLIFFSRDSEQMLILMRD